MIKDYGHRSFLEHVNTGALTAEDVRKLQLGVCHRCGNDTFREVHFGDFRLHYQCNRCPFPFAHDAEYFSPGRVFGNPHNTQYTQPGNVVGTDNTSAILALVLGLCGIFAWFIPLVGFPVTIVGLVSGRKALRMGQSRSMAKAGIILCIIFLVVTAINSALGALGAIGVIDLASWFF